MVQFNHYDGIIDLSAVKDFCRENGRLYHYAKNDVFVQQGTVGKYLGVIESGYFKYTTLTSLGNESVVGFAFAGEIVTDFHSSYLNKISEVTIKAGKDSSVSQIRMIEAIELLNSVFDGKLSFINNTLFCEIYSRYLELHRKAPTERYLDLITKYPQVLDTVSLRDIASYLLVTPVYLSRIRKKLAKKIGQ